MLLICYAIYIPAKHHNLIPPFIMREAGIIVNDVPKIHVDDPTDDDHVITFPETGFWILLKLVGIFSYFPCCKPSKEGFEACEEVYTLTPPRLNPHLYAYAQNEDPMVDWNGEIIEKRHRNPILLEDIMDDDLLMSSLQVDMAEAGWIDEIMATNASDVKTELMLVPYSADEVNLHMNNISALLHPGVWLQGWRQDLQWGKVLWQFEQPLW